MKNRKSNRVFYEDLSPEEKAKVDADLDKWHADHVEEERRKFLWRCYRELRTAAATG